MKKLTTLLESKRENLQIASINTNESFVAFVHEKLKHTVQYNKASVEMLAENLLQTHSKNYTLAAKALENFQKHS